MRGEPEDELEIVPLDGAARPPPSLSVVRRTVAWAGRHRRPLLAVVLGVALFGTSYTAFAVRGLRALERHTRSAIVLREQYDTYVAELRPARPTSYRLLAGDDADTRVRRATAEYGTRMAELADRARAVVVVDPTLRRLRRRTVGFLGAEAARARTASTRTSPWLAPARVDTTLLQDALRRWRRPPGAAPDVRGLRSVRAVQAAAPLLDEPTGARLFVPTREGLLEVDVDRGAVHTHGDGGGGQWAVGDGFLATVEAGNGLIRPFGGRGTERPVGRYDVVHRDADDPALAWFVTGPLDPGDARRPEAHAFDRDGVRRGEALPAGGAVVAVSSRWLVRAYYGERDELVVDDRRTAEPAARLRSARFHAVRGDTLVYSADHRLVLRDLVHGTERVVLPPRGDLSTSMVDVAPDGTRLAVVWTRVFRNDLVDAVLVVHDGASLRPLATVSTGEEVVFPQPAWSHSGTWLFVLVGSEFPSGGRVLAWREGLAQPKTVLLEGEFYGLSAF